MMQRRDVANTPDEFPSKCERELVYTILAQQFKLTPQATSATTTTMDSRSNSFSSQSCGAGGGSMMFKGSLAFLVDIVEFLLMHGRCSLVQLYRGLHLKHKGNSHTTKRVFRKYIPGQPHRGISLKQIKFGLLLLLQHNMLDMTVIASNSTVQGDATTSGDGLVTYAFIIRECFYRLYYPKIIYEMKERFGCMGEVIVEELILMGRLRLDQSLESIAYNYIQRMKQEKTLCNEDASAKKEVDDQQPMDDENDPSEVSEDELEDAKFQVMNTFLNMIKQKCIQRVFPTRRQIPLESSPAASPGASSTTSVSSNNGGRDQDQGKMNGTGNGMNEPNRSIRMVKKRRVVATVNQVVEAPSEFDMPIELQLMMENQEEKDSQSKEKTTWSESSSSGDRKRKRCSNNGRGGLGSLESKSVAGAVAFSEGEKNPTRFRNGMDFEKAEEDNMTDMMEEKVWRLSMESFIQTQLRHVCVRFVSENTNRVAGAIVEGMLSLSLSSDKQTARLVTSPIDPKELLNLASVKEAMPKGCANQLKLLVNYMTVLCRDKAGILSVVKDSTTTAAEGQRYVLHLNNIVKYLKDKTQHSFISDRFGIESARIIRVLQEKKQLEEKTVSELVMLPASETRRRLLELYSHGFLKLQEVPKRSDYNPQQVIYCWSVQFEIVYKEIMARLKQTFGKLSIRRAHELENGRDLIDRSDSLMDAKDIEAFDRLSRGLDRLDQAGLHCSEMLMLFQDF